MESSNSPLLQMDDISPTNGNLPNPVKNEGGKNVMTDSIGLLRVVRRGIRVTKKYLNDEKDISTLNIAKTDNTGRNIFHLSVQREELLQFILKKFEKHPQINEALYTEDVNGNTPAHIAALHNAKKSVQILGAVDKNVFKYRSKLTGKSIIHCAVESGSEYMVEDILDNTPDALYDKDANLRPAQHYAAALKESAILEYLLGQGADMMETDESGSTALHVAAESGSISNVMLIVIDDIELVNIVDKEDQTALHVACKNGYSDIVSFLLGNGADPVQRNNSGCTALECAINNKQEGVVDDLLRGDDWKRLTDECKGGAKNVFAILLAKMPRSAEVMLDRYIQSSDQDQDAHDFCVTYDFGLLQPTATNPPTFEVLSAILKSDKESCLSHDVCQKYLIFMWRERGFMIYILNFVIYLIFHVLFNVYIMLVRGAIAKSCIGSSNQTTISPLACPQPHARPREPGPLVTTVIIVSITLLNMIREVVQLSSTGWAYFKHTSNYFEWLLYVSVLVFMFPVRNTKSVIQFGFGSFAVFFSWFNLIWFVRRLPDLGTYILALRQVFNTLVKMLSIITLFCMAFASTFYLMLAEQPRFRNYGISLLSTFVAMLGDFGYDDLFVTIGYHRQFYTFKLIAFVVFMLLMGIVVNNVLIGLAVGDTDNVMNKAKVQRLREQAEFVIEIETSVMNKIPWPWRQRHLETKVIEYPNHAVSSFQQFKNFMFGESNLWNAEDESEGEDSGAGISEERLEEIINKRLDNYHKQILREMKEFHVDIMQDIENSRVGSPGTTPADDNTNRNIGKTNV